MGAGLLRAGVVARGRLGVRLGRAWLFDWGRRVVCRLKMMVCNKREERCERVPYVCLGTTAAAAPL